MFDYKLKTCFLILFIALTASWKSQCYGQNRQSTELEIHFPISSYTQQLDFMNNQETLLRLDELLIPNGKHIVESIHIKGYSSLEGSITFNQKISLERANTVKYYIQNRYPAITSKQILTAGEGENWEKLRKLVEDDMNTPNRSKILYIIDNVPAAINYSTNTSRKKSLMELGITSWNYMYQNMFPYLRSVVSIVVTVKNEPEKSVEEEVVKKSAEEVIDSANMVVLMAEVALDKEVTIQEKTEYQMNSKPLLALKTNLLFDIASALNVEMEIPVGKHWSIAAEYIFPWWLWESKQYSLQTLSGNIEGRYWLGNRDKRQQLTGWFAGFYVGGGYYDFEWGSKGYQGEFFIIPGISGGYAHTINKKRTLRMEYLLGIGYMRTLYHEYIPKYGADDQWHLIRQRNGTYDWAGPTRVKVSLVWMLNHKKKGGLK